MIDGGILPDLQVQKCFLSRDQRPRAFLVLQLSTSLPRWEGCLSPAKENRENKDPETPTRCEQSCCEVQREAWTLRSAQQPFRHLEAAAVACAPRRAAVVALMPCGTPRCVLRDSTGTAVMSSRVVTGRAGRNPC